MLNQKELEELVKKEIEKDENLGESAGGSGHLSYTTYEIENISPLEQIIENSKNLWKLKYSYSTFVETEFTYYPDNPPYQYKHEKVVYLDENFNIIDESNKK